MSESDTVPASEQDSPPEIPVADQKAAGVPAEETVTLADQRAGTPPPPEAVAAVQGDSGTAGDGVETLSVPDTQQPDGPSPAEQQAAGLPVQQPDPEAVAHTMPAAPDEAGQPDGVGQNEAAGTEGAPGVVTTATSNESVQLAQTPAGGAARALAGTEAALSALDAEDPGLVRRVLTWMKDELSRVVPGDHHRMAADEVSRKVTS